MKKHLYLKVAAAIVILLFAGTLLACNDNDHEIILWRFDNIQMIGHHPTHVLGAPQAIQMDGDTSVVFDGVGDALVLDEIPIAGWRQFTIEVLIHPDADGPTAPRFMHFEDKASNRGTMEMRITNKQWYMDCFLKNGDTTKPNERLTLIDSTLLHPCDRWYWVAMTYDGSTMRSFINGQLELHGEVEIPAFGEGQISIGARLNKVNWFKGAIKEMRFHSKSLAAKELQQVR